MAALGMREAVIRVRWLPSDPLALGERPLLDLTVAAARTAGLRVVFATYPYPPREVADGVARPEAFGAWLAELARRYPDVRQFVVGNEPNQAGNFSTRYVQTLVYSRPLESISDRLTYVGQTDFGYQNDAMADGRDAYWYGLNQYLFYTVSDCMSYGIRAEWFRDEQGFRVLVPFGPAGRNSYPGSFYEITIGANWKYSANTVVRPYVRFDWFSGDSLGGPGLLPFDDGTGNSQTLIGGDIVTIF